jgi:rRNA-processing protein FCF1
LPLSVVLDTNFLTVPAQFGVDIFAETERTLETRVDFIVLRSVVGELEQKLETARGRAKSRFRIALTLLDRCRIEDDALADDQAVDDRLLEYTRAAGGVLATNDRELRSRAIAEGIPVLILRSKKHVELVGSIL